MRHEKRRVLLIPSRLTGPLCVRLPLVTVSIMVVPLLLRSTHRPSWVLSTTIPLSIERPPFDLRGNNPLFFFLIQKVPPAVCEVATLKLPFFSQFCVINLPRAKYSPSQAGFKTVPKKFSSGYIPPLGVYPHVLNSEPSPQKGNTLFPLSLGPP